VCQRELHVGPLKFRRMEKTIAEFPRCIVIRKRKHRDSDEWAAFVEWLLANGDGSETQGPHKAEAGEASP
jgi:hypothetical protein